MRGKTNYLKGRLFRAIENAGVISSPIFTNLYELVEFPH